MVVEAVVSHSKGYLSEMAMISGCLKKKEKVVPSGNRKHMYLPFGFWLRSLRSPTN
jgi:hypothetical protein